MKICLAFVMIPILGALGTGCETLSEVLADAPKPSARVVDVALGDLSLSGLTLVFDVEVTNPYSVDLPVTRVDYGLASKGAAFLTGDAQLSGAIPAAGSRVLTLPAAIEFAALFDTIGELRPGAVVPYEADLAFHADAPGIGPVSLPVRRSGSLPIPSVPDVKVDSVQWDELTLTKAGATVNLRIGNTSAFPVDIDQFRYDLDLGGTSVANATIRSAPSLEPGEAKVIALPISLTPIDLGLAVFSMLQGEDADYRLGGSMKLGTPYGPIEVPIDARGSTPFVR